MRSPPIWTGGWPDGETHLGVGVSCPTRPKNTRVSSNKAPFQLSLVLGPKEYARPVHGWGNPLNAIGPNQTQSSASAGFRNRLLIQTAEAVSTLPNVGTEPTVKLESSLGHHCARKRLRKCVAQKMPSAGKTNAIAGRQARTNVPRQYTVDRGVFTQSLRTVSLFLCVEMLAALQRGKP